MPFQNALRDKKGFEHRQGRGQALHTKLEDPQMMKTSLLAALFAVGTLTAQASHANSFDSERQAILGMTGCYLIDYSFTEVESLKPGYVLDERVYDVNQNKSVKEWIYADEIGGHRIRLQHVMFAVDLSGKLMEGTELKHQVEEWEHEAPFLYEFTGPLTWQVKDLTGTSGQWTRKITNLDDGLRYQCSAPWNVTNEYAEWACGNNYAPIPGRETRDMGRKDYQTLMRSTRILNYGNSWLERQDNVKTIHVDGVRTPLARELGRNWYVRLPDSECQPARNFAAPRQAFWRLLRETWDQVLVGDRPFIEVKVPAGSPSRFMEITAIEGKYLNKNLGDAKVKKTAQDEIIAIINRYRAN